jgi:hypothetical protein
MSVKVPMWRGNGLVFGAGGALACSGEPRAGGGGFQGGVGVLAMILKSETYNFHRLDLTRQASFVVTIYDEDRLTLAATTPFPTPAEAFAEARKIADNRVEGPTD